MKKKKVIIKNKSFMAKQTSGATARQPQRVTDEFVRGARAATAHEQIKQRERERQRFRTTLMIPMHLIVQAQDMARGLGLSTNAALCVLIDRGLTAMRAPSPLPQTVIMQAASPSSSTSFGNRASLPEERLLKKFGEGFESKGDMPDEPDFYCEWDKIQTYAEEYDRDPSRPYYVIGKKLGFTESEARAADLAIDLGEYARYMKEVERVRG